MKGTLQNLSEEELKSTVKNMFIIERNIALYAADQYAEIDATENWDDLLSIANELDELLNELNS